jgi:23S rRNA pseudouridine2605 synthase
VTLNERVCRNPDQPTNAVRDRISVDTMPITAEPKVYVMLNKPLGMVASKTDEQGRSSEFRCLPVKRAGGTSVGDLDQPLFGKGQKLPAKITLPEQLSPVGRPDQSIEGLLLFTNDNEWADRITAPTNHLDKTYHVQVNRVADEAFCQQLKAGIKLDGETMTAKRVAILRGGDKNSWLEITLDEGRNRHLRRLLSGCGAEALRLIRIGVGSLQLAPLAKGQWRHLTLREIAALRGLPAAAPKVAAEEPSGRRPKRA